MILSVPIWNLKEGKISEQIGRGYKSGGINGFLVSRGKNHRLGVFFANLRPIDPKLFS